MCEFCTQHGEGKKWYLQAENYIQEVASEERQQMRDQFAIDYEGLLGDGVGRLSQLQAADPAKAKSIFPIAVERQKAAHWGQVVPMEEIEQILDLPVAVVRVTCACRSTLRGYREPRFCFGVTAIQDVGPRTYHPDFSGDLEYLDKDTAKAAIRKLDKMGLVHSVWTFISPHIGGICNCSSNDCIALKSRMRMGLQTLFKAEYVAQIDPETCNGCRNCMRLCNFGAIGYSPHSNKCTVNQLQCFGCGVCRAICVKKSITLRDRNAIPVLANEW